ncbi:hypothetical protein [Xanthomonas phaseoli]|uniref:Uncharacterized protein n=1 Tax=Xanthomonas phaseoli pv. dieffenbachiae TaxID=92828 RepID=A0A1V9H3D7_9XANT|nr:hypothetical protein [Xanthomonas phaseoli]MBO9788278.1 hypothetical protein [Xanthomonas phaseoli pv. dieffenbachiae]MBO9915665.1 hypothetical protein [Xanthomonas phaseoli pv. dieffenbachiae]MBO9938076.1 hypothetical protein [Xanthomonas phaseoli pv. dieffenbachiae]MBO9994397.1 hypothetical protein [Xanthomonas phaseoli pv. dieffenbachiae]OQP77356.1 hypothetical protein IM53_013585 [Xanthomonas phaseoli pv. dieffenbachiae]
MEASPKSLKAASLKEIEDAIAQALSQFTTFPPHAEIRAFEVLTESAVDVLTFDTYRFELKVKAPKHGPSKGALGLD